eukprot:scaffold95413_cov63-Phaeocystis_antarctica.AAC.2
MCERAGREQRRSGGGGALHGLVLADVDDEGPERQAHHRLHHAAAEEQPKLHVACQHGEHVDEMVERARGALDDDQVLTRLGNRRRASIQRC